MLKGYSASKGIAIASVYIYQKEMPVVTKKKISDAAISLKVLDKAIETSVKELEYLIDTSQHSDIFKAHLEILTDVELYDQTKMLIEDELRHETDAFHQVTTQFIDMFDQMEDAYFKERAIDVKDIQYRVLCHMTNMKVMDLSTISEPVVIVAHDLTPSDTSSLNLAFVKGFITEVGGVTSHTAIMARSLNIPAIVGVKDLLTYIKPYQTILLDAIHNEIVISPNDERLKKANQDLEKFNIQKEMLKQYKDQKTTTKDGHHVGLFANIGSVKDVDFALEYGAEGVGLFRTEFLFMDSTVMPSLELQIKNYEAVFKQLDKVIIRTLDIGGDKALPYLKQPHEDNPFLGHRAVRLCLDEKEMFKTQLKAILIASKLKKQVDIMIPMIARVDEVLAVREVLNEVIQSLDETQEKYQKNIKLGIMIEIPSAALNVKRLAKHVDFISIGSNDLIQYLFAADRMNEKVSYLYEPFDPTLLEVIYNVIKTAKDAGIETGLCGEIGSNPQIALLLTAMKIDEISMSASSILEVRKYLSDMNFTDLEHLLHDVIACDDASAVKKTIEVFLREKK